MTYGLGLVLVEIAMFKVEKLGREAEKRSSPGPRQQHCLWSDGRTPDTHNHFRLLSYKSKLLLGDRFSFEQEPRAVARSRCQTFGPSRNRGGDFLRRAVNLA